MEGEAQILCTEESSQGGDFRGAVGETTGHWNCLVPRAVRGEGAEKK